MDISNTCPVPNGTLVIIGGAENKGDQTHQEMEAMEVNTIRMEVLKSFVDILNSKEAHIEVITTAGSKAPEESFNEYKNAFEKLGAHTVNHIHHDAREQVQLDEMTDRIKAAHGIFLAGGDQLKLTSIYGGTDLLLLLKQRYIHANLVIAGTSAGAMAMSTPMIYQGVGRDEMIAGNVKITTGLEFLRDICIDTHFVNRGRFVRMSQVIATNPTSIGLGIEEDTAVVIRRGRYAEVIGLGVVIIINGRQSYGTNIFDHEKDEPVTVRGLLVDILSKGQTFEIEEINPPHL